jgi:Ras-related protein Rab-1A
VRRCVKLRGISPSDTTIKRKLASFKFVALGDSGVGKTCLLLRYAKGTFLENHNATIGCDLYFKNVEIAGNVITLSIWDSSGQERYDAIAPSYMRSAHGVFLVYDITSRETFDHLEKWIKLAKDLAPDAHMILIGNKADVPEIREVSTKQGKALAAELGITFLETSAKQAYNVEAAFRALTASALETYQQSGIVDYTTTQLTTSNETTSTYTGSDCKC